MKIHHFVNVQTVARCECVRTCVHGKCVQTHTNPACLEVWQGGNPRSPCVWEGGRDVIAGFSDVHEENSRDDISRPTMFLRLGSALARSARQNISASFLAYSKQHCCTSLLRCHRVSTFCTQTHWLCVCVVCGWQGRGGEVTLKTFHVEKIVIGWWHYNKSASSNTLQPCITVNENPNYLKREKHDRRQTWFDEVNQ